MKSSTISFLLKDALKNIKRRASTSVFSIVAVMLMLFILEIFVLSALNLKIGIVDTYSSFEVVVTLKDGINATEKQDVYEKIKAANVGININADHNNPLSAAYIIKVRGQDDVPKAISKLKGMEGVDEINGGQNIPGKALVMIRVVQWGGVIIFFILMIATFFLIKYTRKIAIHTRINEINIMQYLGATDMFIKLRFIFEGIIIGFLGAVLSLVAIYFSYSFVFREVGSFFETTFISFISPSFILTTISWSSILIGIILITIGSNLIIKKLLIV